MRRMLSLFLTGVMLSLLTQTACAAGQNAAPFGLEISVATLADVKKEIGATSRLANKGVNKYTEGSMLSTAGEGLGIDGLKEVLFIFDKSERLAGVILTMPKDPKSMFRLLSGKYKVKTNRIDNFMNNGYARLDKGDSIIEIDAPHMSFDMEIRYVANSLMKLYNQTTNTESADKERRKSNALYA